MSTGMLKRLGLGVAALALLAAVAAASLLGYRAYRQHETAQLLKIDSANGIDEAQFVRIGGVEEWVQIRGESRDNPAILFLHGGPGFSAIPYFQRAMRPWESDYTIVHWDQRGAGKSFARNGGTAQPKPQFAQMVSDGIDVAEYARRRLQRPKLILIGYSWGSALGLEMVRTRPDLFYAYVGTGQIMDTAQSEVASYRDVLALAKAARDQRSVDTLTAIGPPPYPGYKELSRERAVLDRYPPPGERDFNPYRTLELAPGYSLFEIRDVYDRAPELARDLLSTVLRYKVTDRGTRFDVPLYFFLGAQDRWTSPKVVEDYLPRISAPHKEIVLFPDVGHHAVEVSSGRFLAELNSRIRPLIPAQRPEGAP